MIIMTLFIPVKPNNKAKTISIKKFGQEVYASNLERVAF